MRKLALPLMAACATLGVVAIPATAGVKLEKKQNKSIGKLAGAVGGVKSAITNLENINLGQTSSVNSAHAKVDALSATVTAVVTAATDALTKLQAGLTTLAAAVQGPNVAGQLGAAGSALPGAANSATPSALPTGTVYRQVVLIAGTGTAADGAPAGIRMWVKMPEVTTPALYSNNEWVCVSSKGTAKVASGAFDAQTNCPAGTAT